MTPAPETFFAINSATEQWRTIPSPPENIIASQVCTSGKRAAFIDVGATEVPVAVRVLDGNALKWRKTRPFPDADTDAAYRIACTKTAIVVNTTQLTASYRLDSNAGQWSAQPAAPAHSEVNYFNASGHDGVVDYWSPLDCPSVQPVPTASAGQRYRLPERQWLTVTSGPCTSNDVGELAWVEGLAFTLRDQSHERRLVVWNP